jgi:hypothetical protein
MFIGHFGAGFAGKKVMPKTSLGTLFLAAQFADLLWPLLLLLGIETVEIQPSKNPFTTLHFTHYPLSHSLFAVFIWAIIFGIIYYLIRKNIRASIWLGALVLSHWVLDFISHKPDLQIVPWSSTVVGLGLWNSVPLTVFIEVSIFLIGVYLYITTTKAKNKTGIYAFWSLVIFLMLMYIMNLFSPPPPSAEPIGYVGLAQWLIVAWGYWIGKNREELFS